MFIYPRESYKDVYIALEETSSPSTPAVSLGEAKKFFREDRDIENAMITSLIRTAEKTISNYTGVHFLDTEFTLHLGSFWDIKIPKKPLKSDSISILYDDEDGAEQTLDSAKYNVYEQESPPKIEFKDDLPSLEDTKYPVRVKFTVGYGTKGNDVPHDLQTAIKLLALIYHRREIPKEEQENINPLRVNTISTLIEGKKVNHFK